MDGRCVEVWDSTIVGQLAYRSWPRGPRRPSWPRRRRHHRSARGRTWPCVPQGPESTAGSSRSDGIRQTRLVQTIS